MPTIARQIEHAKSTGLLPIFQAVAADVGVPYTTLLAIASRESAFGLTLDDGFLGDNGYGHGIMQIDRRWHDFANTTAPNDHPRNIAYSAKYLKALKKQLGSWPEALAAYNAGAGNVRKAQKEGRSIDYYTTGRDYSADVLRRKKEISEIVAPGAKLILPLAIATLLIGYYARS